ncbi:MAG: sugar ABC transporter ATP-binding protein [Caldilinea sp.]|nr:sugar ABC transporter ATP-binding protein [Caldilinea sp.]MCB9116124.1 sugar ABC transporter ATP-binding protein [Caldilineaceae bacterium]MCB9118925.1 sugar ABC transporter ATP-binding protein [Caldilineaceae bacterium]MCO5208725.1 sugar ABC transporter ATP-binding protein [Caldilinea sp.]
MTTAPTPLAGQSAAQDDAVALHADQVTKVFPGTVALDHVDFNVYRGKVNALIGENGAGKSTLMKIMAGVERPTGGELLLDGKPIQLRSPLHAEQLGIGIIYQEMNLCPNLSVAENIYLGRELAPTGLVVDKKAQRTQTRALMQRLEHAIDPDTLVSDLRIGQQQIVEIAKALAQDVRILIMDEPTSALSASEVEVLFKVIADLKAHGVSIIYISHKLEEITQISDYVTVLRDGRLVAEARNADIDVPWIIEKMVGKNPANLFHKGHTEVGGEILRVEEITLPRLGGGFAVDHVSLTLRRGEVVGIYGLMGAGRSELFECLAGVHPDAGGQVFLEGKLLPAGNVSGRISEGIVLVPEDRQREGLVQSLSVAHNVLLASLRNYFNGLFLAPRKEQTAVTEMIKGLTIKVADPGQIITSLSGGNQQKVVVAKGLLTSPKILLLDEPSRGIDVAAKSEIFAIMERLAAQGFGVLFISSELKEVMAMSDRILVMSKGKITGEFLREEATEEALVAASAIGHGAAENGSKLATAATHEIITA